MTSDRQSQCSRIQPDGLTGVLLALEGIADAAVILHGPTGCRGHHSAMSERAFPRGVIQERLNYAERFYFGQPRIPSTYLDGDDFIFGAGEKLRRAIRAVMTGKPALLAVVNAPSAALIGEDLRRCMTEEAVSVPGVTIEMPSISQPIADGYQQAVIAVLEALKLRQAPVRSGTVNLIGLSIGHRHWEGSLVEIRRLLGLCGVEVLCSPGAGSPATEWLSIPHADCHAVVHEEYADRIAGWLTNRFEAPVVFPESGAPIGFEATEQWIGEVTRTVGADPSPALADIRERRRQVSYHMSRIAGIGGALKGMTFGTLLEPSIAFPLVRFLYGYLGMLPVSVSTTDYGQTRLGESLREFLSEIGCSDAWQAGWQEAEADFLFADGHQVNQNLSFGCPERGIELFLPLDAEVDFVRKSLLGPEGAAHLVERIVNAVPGLL